MLNINKFPESREKDYLRDLHLQMLAERHTLLGRQLNYFGLPSAAMSDVHRWRGVLGQIVAVESDVDLVIPMQRRATQLKLHDRLIIIERPLHEVTKFLALEEGNFQAYESSLNPAELKKFISIRKSGFDVINIDPYGGFLYPSGLDDSESKNLSVLRDLVHYQARQKTAFHLLITFQLRDGGRDHYDSFIAETLNLLEAQKENVKAMRDWYLAEKAKNPPSLQRKLKFCVPLFLHKTAYDHFHVKNVGTWQYKNFFHAALFFEPRKNTGLLGLPPYPPVDECRDLLRVPTEHLKSDEEGNLIVNKSQAPVF